MRMSYTGEFYIVRSDYIESRVKTESAERSIVSSQRDSMYKRLARSERPGT
jgi:hypothetical protein